VRCWWRGAAFGGKGQVETQLTTKQIPTNDQTRWAIDLPDVNVLLQRHCLFHNSLFVSLDPERKKGHLIVTIIENSRNALANR